MGDEERLVASELAAAELVSHVRLMDVTEVEFPIVDENCVWVVSVKRMGIEQKGPIP